MRFRTEIEPVRTQLRITLDTPLLMLGSCFTDEVGARLEMDGFDVLHNPFGALYNPLSVENCLRRAIKGPQYSMADLTQGPRGFHCLDYASRFSGDDAGSIIESIECWRAAVASMLVKKPVVIITLGSAFVFERNDTGTIAGNCHKFPNDYFSRRKLSPEEAEASLSRIAGMLGPCVSALIFTVSPIRHLADGLHGNNLSKATLLLATDNVADKFPFVLYFPAYEALVDDLRDYRFYAADMKHPSETAVDYIYDIFSDTFFDPDTKRKALECRRSFRASCHRQIL